MGLYWTEKGKLYVGVEDRFDEVLLTRSLGPSTRLRDINEDFETLHKGDILMPCK
jgi:hypothetical protein